MRKLTFIITGFLLFAMSGLITAQNLTVTGVLTDATTKEPLPFATIQVKGTLTGAYTDDLGRYSISAPGNAVLIFSFIGYKSVEVPVNNRALINAEIEREATTLDDVIVVAYGEAKRESITGAVASISAREIEKRSMASISGVLDGQASGVLVVNTGGPGSSPSVRIRGFTTITGSNSPLYILDGVPFAGNISDLNTNDIENISVLKDAASAALYGNRASNGVILITSKRGKSGKVSVNAQARAGAYSWAQPEFEKLNTTEWMETMWTGYRNSMMSNPDLAYDLATANDYATKNLVESYLGYNIFDRPNDQLFDQNGKFLGKVLPGYTDLNWWDAVQNVGLYQDYNVSANHATDKGSLYISVGHHNNEGNVLGSSYKRYTANTNVSVTPNRWLSAGVKANLSYQETNEISTGSTAYKNPIYYGRFMSPIYPIYLHDAVTGEFILDDDGNKQYDRGDYYDNYTRKQNLDRHILWEMELDRDKTYRTTLGGQAWANVKFLKDFNFKVVFDYSLRNTENRSYNSGVIGDGAANNGRASRSIYRYMTLTAQEQLSWSKTFNRHSFSALAAHENYYSNYVWTDLYKTGQVFPNKYELINFTELVRMNGYDNNLRSESYLGSLKYNFDNKYYVEAMVRTDGSSKFHQDNRWGVFWSLGFTWSVHREPFMAGVDFVDALRVRASYGQVGNDGGAGTYAYHSLYANSKNAGMGAAYKSQNEAQNLMWESSNSTTLGFEGTLFDRLNFVLDFYMKNSADLLFNVRKPLSVGSTTSGSSMSPTQTINFGSMNNKGVELELNYDVIRKRDFTWNVNLIAAIQDTRVGKLPKDLLNEDEMYISGNKVYKEGEPYNAYWIYQYVGVDQMTGLALYEINEKLYYTDPTLTEEEIDGRTQVPGEYLTTINGKEYTTYSTYANRDWFGNKRTSLNKVFGSIGTSITWKNFDFSVSFVYGIGGYATSGPWNSLMSVGTSPSAISKDILKSWNGIPEGMTETSPDRIDPNGFPKVDWYTNGWKTTSAASHLHSKSFLNIRNVSLTYNLPRRIVERMDMTGISLNVNVENLWLFNALNGLDVYSTGGGSDNLFGTNRTFTVGLNLRF